MNLQVLLLGGPHNGSLFTQIVIGEAPLELRIGEEMEGTDFITSLYRLIATDENRAIKVASYEYLDEIESAASLVDRWERVS